MGKSLVPAEQPVACGALGLQSGVPAVRFDYGRLVVAISTPGVSIVTCSTVNPTSLPIQISYYFTFASTISLTDAPFFFFPIFIFLLSTYTNFLTLLFMTFISSTLVLSPSYSLISLLYFFHFLFLFMWMFTTTSLSPFIRKGALDRRGPRPAEGGGTSDLGTWVFSPTSCGSGDVPGLRANPAHDREWVCPRNWESPCPRPSPQNQCTRAQTW